MLNHLLNFLNKSNTHTYIGSSSGKDLVMSLTDEFSSPKHWEMFLATKIRH